MLAVISSSAVTSVLVVAAVAWLTANLLVASYGRDKGYPFFPIFVSAWFLGFPLVLLVVTIVAARKDRV